MTSAWHRSGKTHVTTYRQVFLLTATGLAAAGLIWNAFESQSDARVEEAIREGSQRQYDAQLIAYNLAIVNYTACVDAAAVRVDARLDARETFFAIVDISDLFDGSALTDGAQRYIDTRTVIIEARLPPLVLETLTLKCVRPGPIPVPPEAS